MSDRVRPNMWQWLRYCFARPLPERHDTWVLHDTTGPTWIWRHLARTVVLVAAPVAALAIFLPTSIGLRLGAIGGGLVMTLIYGAAYIVESTELRLTKAGYPVGLGERVRRERAENAQRMQASKRREAIARRRARRAA